MSGGGTGERIRVLVAKPGLDGHDRGAKVVARGLRDAGMEVVYSGLHRTPEQIVRTALDEDVHCVGLSILSGAHVPLCQKIAAELRAVGAAPVVWVVGGTVPAQDHAALEALGVAKVFPTGSRLDEVVAFLREKVRA